MPRIINNAEVIQSLMVLISIHLFNVQHANSLQAFNGLIPERLCETESL